MEQQPEFFEYPDSPRPSKSQARKARRAKRASASGAGISPLVPKTPNQRVYIDSLRRGENVFGVGPAGTGKTYIPARLAARRLLDGTISKIVICRVAVSAPKHALGFLPGKIDQKLAPWLVPVFDGLRAEMSATTLDKLRQENRIEVIAFEHLRGRSLQDSCIILDEAQNANIADLKLFLTRIGENSQVVVTGDLDQIDVRDSGLLHALYLAERYNVPMRVVRFDESDVVRSAFTKAWVMAFAAEDDTSAAILDHAPAFLHNAGTVTKSDESDF